MAPLKKSDNYLLNHFPILHHLKELVLEIRKEFNLKDNSIFNVDENITFDEYGNPLYLESPLKK